MKTYNTAPYYDDFSESSNYHQIMFKPGYAVQARELTQLQTILRGQIEKFGNHIFKHGSVVIPGNSYADLSASYIKLQPQYNSVSLNLANFEGKVVVGVTSGIRAYVKKAVAAVNTDPITLYVSYLSGNGSNTISFSDSEEIYVEDSTGIRALLQSSSSTGQGSLAVVNTGVYYVNGTFVHVDGQIAVISKYTTTPSCHVLLKITEELIDSIEDTTLLDPAQGSYNYAAPGADRVKITLTLTSLDLGSTITDDYVELMRYNVGVLEEHSKYPKYSELEKSLARRTFDESGNYVVNGLLPTVKEHLKSNNNGGVYADGDASKLVVDVTPGKAYINGFEVNKIANTKIAINKARTAAHIKDTEVVLRPEFGQYLIVSNIYGTFSIYNHDVVDLYNDNDASNASATKIGTARVVGTDYLAGDPASVAVYKLWVTDVTLNAGYTLEDAGGIRYNSTKYAYVLTQYYAPISSGGFTAGEIINHSSGRTATVKYWDGTSSTLYAYKHNHAQGTPRVGDLIVGASSSTTSTVATKTMMVSVGQSGLVFRLPKAVPYSLRNADTNNYDLVYTVQKELSITTDGSGNGSVSVGAGETIDPIEVGTFVAVGPSGIVQNSKFSLNVSGTTLTIAAGPTSSAVKIYAAVTKDSVSPKTKTVTSYSQVISSPTSTITLEKTDVIGIASIIDSVGDITANYTFWNGQTDYAYNRATLTLKSGKPVPSGSVTVTYTYYAHSIAGDFFCINSYPSGILDSTTVYQSTSTGQLYDLPACLDFRSSVGSNGEFTGTNSRRNDLIISGTTFNSSLQYYVPRIDTLTVDPTGNLTVVSGTPAESPTAPSIPIGQFAINLMYIPEYTKTASQVAVKRLDVERFTMQDIKGIVNRVGRVEDFATLTAAELSVTGVNITDAESGLDRFKTGYLVESFTSPLGIARTTAADYAATFIGDTLHPVMENLLCELVLQDSSSNYVVKNGYAMLPYTEEVFASQTLSSRTTNINPFLVIKWDGILNVNPPSDNWTEVVDRPTIFEERTEEVVVEVSVPAPHPEPTSWDPGPVEPSLPPLPPTTFGGWYGDVLGRLGEGTQTTGTGFGGVDYWSSSIASGQSVNQVAQTFLETALHNYAVGTDWGREQTFNAVSVEQLSQNTVMASQTVYSYGAGGQIVATTSGVDIYGTAFSYRS